MNDVSDVIVVGGGIGGLTTAIALRQAGIRARVYERAAELRGAESGNGLVVWHNATLALRAIGADEALHKIGEELERYQFRSRWRGTLADWSIAQGAERTGAPAYTVSRPALHRMLSETVGDDLILESRVVGFAEDASGVTVHFGDGSDARGDLLVGADGLRSTVRGGLLPHEPPPSYSGITAWQGVVHLPDGGVPSGTFVNTLGAGRWFVYYGLGDDYVYWDGVISDPVARGIASIGESKKDIVARVFADWPDPISTLIASTPDSDIQAVGIYDRDPVARWSTSRVTLVGDAAHPMTFNLGQGANQAIEGAVVLAQCLAGAADIDESLRSYERRRIGRTAAVTKRSRANGTLLQWRNPAACLFRDVLMRAIFDRVAYRKTYQLTMDMDLEDHRWAA